MGNHQHDRGEDHAVQVVQPAVGSRPHCQHDQARDELDEQQHLEHREQSPEQATGLAAKDPRAEAEAELDEPASHDDEADRGVDLADHGRAWKGRHHRGGSG